MIMYHRGRVRAVYRNVGLVEFTIWFHGLEWNKTRAHRARKKWIYFMGVITYAREIGTLTL